MLQDDDIIPLEFLDLLRSASDELCGSGTRQHRPARPRPRGLRSRRRDLGLQCRRSGRESEPDAEAAYIAFAE